MKSGPLLPSGSWSSMTRIALGLASALFLFTAENIWIDPWLRHKHHRIPSLVPKALSGAWFFALVIGGVILALLVVWQILLMRDPILPVWTKIGTGIAVLTVVLLSVEWCGITTGRPAVFMPRGFRKTHTVKLTWNASISKAVGYNVYRSGTHRANYLKINNSLVQGLTYTDDAVDNGATYYYVTRAVDARGQESVNSNETSAAIPLLW